MLINPTRPAASSRVMKYEIAATYGYTINKAQRNFVGTTARMSIATKRG
jgi:hypothetical protein